jgi:hypothetical protein
MNLALPSDWTMSARESPTLASASLYPSTNRTSAVVPLVINCFLQGGMDGVRSH